MIGVATALALWSVPSLPWANDARTQRSTPAKGWVLEVRQDNFTGAKSCTIKARDMTYRHGVLTFRFGTSVDTANALYRVDQGPARSVGVVAPEAAGLGAEFKSRNTKNPSNGRVHLPTSQLQAAQTVSIRPNPGRRPQTFRLTGFETALSAARTQGCDVV